MNVLLAFDRRPGEGSVVPSIRRFGEEITSHALQPFAGWNGEAVVANPPDETVTVHAARHEFLIAAGRYAGTVAAGRAGRLDEMARDLTGHFLLVRQRAAGPVEICTDPMASIPLYVFQSGEHIRLSTRLDWLLASVGRPWRVSWAQIFCFVLNSSYAGRGVFVDDVKLADFGSCYAFREDGSFTAVPYWEPPYDGQARYEDNARAVADALLDAIARVSQRSDRVAISLTSGVDSRLILAATLHVAPAKIETVTYGFVGSLHADVTTPLWLAAKMSLPHFFLDSTGRVREQFRAVDDSGLLWRNLGGQARHNFVYDVMMYEELRRRGWGLELRGLAGGLFKAKWHGMEPTPHIVPARTRRHMAFFGGEARAALENLDAFFLEQSMKDAPSRLSDREREGWLSYAVRFSNRIGPRTFFQALFFPSINPFYDRRFIDAYLGIRVEDRVGAMTHLRTIARLRPELLEVPYSRGGARYAFRDGAQHPLNRSWPFRRLAQRIWGGIDRRLGLTRRMRLPPIPANWEYMKSVFLERVPPVLEDAKALFPRELEPLTPRGFAEHPVFDARSFRLYSMLKFMIHCRNVGISLS